MLSTKVTAADLAAKTLTCDNGNAITYDKLIVATGRGLHSSTFQLNLSRFRHVSPCLPV
jgi:NADH dehydrogenase FAD-containing subunit